MLKLSLSAISGFGLFMLNPVAFSLATPANPVEPSQSFPSTVAKNSQLQVAQTVVGYCTVADPTGTPLNVRATPNGKVIGTLKNGTPVALGVTDGSEGPQWTRIIKPLEGYVWSEYLKDCQ